MDYLQPYLSKLEKSIEAFPLIDQNLTELQKKTNVKKVYIAAGVISVAVLWLMFGYGAQLLCNTIGFIYPAYYSIKAIESGDKLDDTKWLTYWVVFAVFSVFEFFSDMLVGWVPFYWLMKCLFLIWCMSPLDGSTLIYKKLVLPVFKEKQTSIDSFLNKGKEKFDSMAGDISDKARAAMEANLKKD